MAEPAKRATSRTRKAGMAASANGIPQFSPSFIAEVGKCDSVDSFRELLDHRGIWLNRNAAQGVYDYLRSLSGGMLSDEELAGVIGGVHADAADEAFISTLRVLADQLN